MRADAQRDGRPAEDRWRRSVIAFLVRRRNVSLTPTARVLCSKAANIGERKTWTQSEFLHVAKFRYGARAPENVICSVPAQETAKHRAKFGWLALRDVAAVTKRRRETPWNLLGCRKLANGSQPLVTRSSLYCGDKCHVLLGSWTGVYRTHDMYRPVPNSSRELEIS